MAKVPTAERRRQLVEAAARVIAKVGLEATTTRMIAAEAGAPQGILHYAFKDKSELLAGVYQYLLDRDAELLATCVDDDCGLEAGVRNLTLGYLEGILREEAMLLANYQIYFWSVSTPNCEGLAAEAHAAYRMLFTGALQRATGGTLDDTRTAALAQFLVNALDGVLIQYLAQRDLAVARKSAETFVTCALQQFG